MGETFAGNIIASLAGLPDFLRAPILGRRMAEFFEMGEGERDGVVRDALGAGHAVPFPAFERLLGTWLRVVADMPEGRRDGLFRAYMARAAEDPGALARYNLDGMMGVFLGLDEGRRGAVSGSLARAAGGLGGEQRRRLSLMVPGAARRLMGI